MTRTWISPGRDSDTLWLLFLFRGPGSCSPCPAADTPKRADPIPAVPGPHALRVTRARGRSHMTGDGHVRAAHPPSPTSNPFRRRATPGPSRLQGALPALAPNRITVRTTPTSCLVAASPTPIFVWGSRGCEGGKESLGHGRLQDPETPLL